MSASLISAPGVCAVSPPLVPRPAGWVAQLRRAAPPWLRVPAALPVPGWVHLLLLAVLLLFDGLMYYFQVVAARKPLPFGLVWLVRNGVLDLLTAALFYWNWVVLIPRTLARGRVGWYLAEMLVSVAACSVARLGLSDLIYHWAHQPLHVRGEPGWELALLLGLIGLGTVLLSTGLYITLDYLRGLRHRHELSEQQLLTELAMLKTQLNPHFLFNTLNNIYSLTNRKSDRAPEAVLRLAENMRYLLYESAAPTVPFAQELRHLRGYLDLQRLRLPQAEAATAIALHVQGAVETALPVAPLLLLPLVENAFKHGDLAARPEAVRLDVEVSATTLRFAVHNYRAPAAGLPPQPGGLGLHNLRRRLALLYPDCHRLTVRELPDEYAVELELTPPLT